jgi:DnaJ-class molecular chaperone
MSFENRSERYDGTDSCGLCNGWGYMRRVSDYNEQTSQWETITFEACPRCDGSGRDDG